MPQNLANLLLHGLANLLLHAFNYSSHLSVVSYTRTYMVILAITSWVLSGSPAGHGRGWGPLTVHTYDLFGVFYIVSLSVAG